MTDRDQLHHLADRARRGVLLPAEYDLLAAGITAMAARVTTLEHVAAGNKRHVQLIVPDLERAERVAQSAARDAAAALTAQLTAEAAIERVRKLANWYADPKHRGQHGQPHSIVAADIRAALDQPQQPTA